MMVSSVKQVISFNVITNTFRIVEKSLECSACSFIMRIFVSITLIVYRSKGMYCFLN
jgi:hypothetical protein